VKPERRLRLRLNGRHHASATDGSYNRHARRFYGVNSHAMWAFERCTPPQHSKDGKHIEHWWSSDESC
jgi:hypothetical protein